MVKPSLFILTTDYATLGNDDGTTISVTAPGFQPIGAGATLTYSTDVVIGAKASLNRIQISSSKDSNTPYETLSLSFLRVGSPSPYNIVAYAFRIDTSTLRCQIIIPNPTGAPMITEAGDETFTFDIDTFIPPFI